MASEPGSAAQRGYAAACPNCGAPVAFASAASASAICSFCRSTLVRDGEALRRIGTSAELFEDHSPLQLGAAGRRQGMAFTLVGRLQYRYAGGTWNEWHALFDNGRSAWLSEDNGAYVLAFDAPVPGDAPPPAALASLAAGTRCTVDGRAWDVASVLRAQLAAGQGELPSPPALGADFTVVDLRNADGEVATLDDSDARRLHWSVGRSVTLSELRLQGLREGSEKQLASRGIACPSCGAPLEPKLASTRSLSCAQCRAVVDISQGVGAELAHYAQNNAGPGGLEPQIPLGRTGRFAEPGRSGDALPWTVVGFLERCEQASGDEEQAFWREYLLYNQQAGFAFLVDADDGWSWVRPLTGAPEQRRNEAIWQGRYFRRRYEPYLAAVTWVQGEFYWRVQREQLARVTDYEASGGGSPTVLSREEADNEVTWSAGDRVSAAAVAEAFGLAQEQGAALQRDVAPLAASSAARAIKLTVLGVGLFVLLLLMMVMCSQDDCAEVRQTFGPDSPELSQCLAQRSSGGSRTSGGSWGGYSSGGHK